MAVDDRPITSGLITQDVITPLSVSTHTEILPLAVVSVGYPIILGLDWLVRHNPHIDWAETNLTLDCCGLTQTHPVTVRAKGFGLTPNLSRPHLDSTTAVGIGFGLADATYTAATSLKTSITPSDTSATAEPTDTITTTPSFLSTLTRWTGYGRSSPPLAPPPPKPNIRTISGSKFHKAWRANPDAVCLIRMLPTGSPAYISATTTALADDLDEDAPSTDERINAIPRKYADYADTVFAPSEFDKLPPHRNFDVDIELEEGKSPPFGPLYRLTPPEREVLAEHINANLKRGHIRQSTSSAAAPVLFIRKKTGNLRLCVDFRGLNAITKKNRYPVPLVHDLLDRVQGCKVFTLIDLVSAYSHLCIKDGDEWKTAFRTPLGLFEHLVVPYGLTNAPASFQAFIQDVLRDILDVVCVVYLDDILIFSRTQDEHDKHVKVVLDQLRNAHLCVNAAKYDWDKPEVEFLGYIIGADGVKMNPTFLSDFDFRLIWAPGNSNIADAPSRRSDFIPKKGDDTQLVQNQRILMDVHTERLLPSPPSDSLASTFSIDAITTLAIDSSALLERFKTAFQEDIEWRESLVRNPADYHVESGLVFHKGRLFVPRPLRSDILHSRHDALVAGHPGRTRTLQLVSRDYSWPGMNTYVRRYVEACDTCARIKTPRHKPYGLLQPLDVPTRPWLSISMDFIVKLPVSHSYDSIWVVCDRLTRYAHFIPCNEMIDAPGLAWLFLDRIFRHHGIPNSIICDRGAVFMSKFWQELTKLLGIQTRASTAYHPQSDGLTERTNQTLETYLRAYCSYQQDDWVDYLPLGEFAFNNLVNTSTNKTAFEANFGFIPEFKPRITERHTVPAAADLASRLDTIHTELRAELQHAQDLQATYHNKKSLPDPDFLPGQMVWLLRCNISTTRPSLKLDHRRLGPYCIIRKIGSAAYLLQLPSYLSRLHPVFHVSLLERYADPSDFHPHASPTPFDLSDNTSPSIHSLLDCRK
ncbi:hypothetical protein EW146_g10426, partial [Bondarzewia mesenterica]